MKIEFPCMKVQMAPRAKLEANAYNPNSVSADKMQLLRQSIEDNGFCFPIVTIYDAERDVFVIIDGFHRFVISGPDWLDLPEVPVVVLDHDLSKRQIATVQFNKARGHHQVDLDAEIVRSLVDQGMSDEDIATRLGMEIDSVHRYKQVAGVAEVFAGVDYSTSWTMVD